MPVHAIPKVILKPQKEKPVLARHPWVFSGAIKTIDGSFDKGDIVTVHDYRGHFLAKGYINSESQITVRLLSFEEGEEFDTAFFRRKIENAIELRKEWVNRETNAFRLIHSEGDFLPGLIVDQYADFLVVQFLTAGMERLKVQIVEALAGVLKPKGIFEKDDSDARAFEKLPERLALLLGDAPPEFIAVLENGFKFSVNVHSGQKTGFFLDQRENRLRVMEHSKGKRVLNCFAYTGGFSVFAAGGDAREVVSVEISRDALKTAEHNMKSNGFEGARYQYVLEDVFNFLRKKQEPFDVIILDPPAFAPNRSSVPQATRGYKDINLYALKMLKPGGLLFTYSCSQHIDFVLFQQILFGAAKDAACRVQILEKSSNPPDHPVSIYHPEGEYLKGFILRNC
ncbi:MAG: class I SAM-dependent rRNA methyltransferase [Candidatus Omnitrophica bacterium]|nr:class I SAM-dependent rRNA methyltransferase [Candidatus Omnitrophota bacterium]